MHLKKGSQEAHPHGRAGCIAEVPGPVPCLLPLGMWSPSSISTFPCFLWACPALPPVPSKPQLPLAPSPSAGILVRESHLSTAGGHVLATDHLRMSALGSELAWTYSVTASVWMPAWCVSLSRGQGCWAWQALC